MQAYVSGPTGSVIERPQKTLQAFMKTGLLAPGDTEEIAVILGRRAFAYWDVSKHGWEVEPGQYTIAVGISSTHIVASAAVHL